MANRARQIRSSLVAAQTDVSDISKEQDKLESDIEQVRSRMARDQQRLDAGSVASAKELESLQHEIISLQRRQRDLEDAELEVMERLEVVQQRADELMAEQQQVARDIEKTERERDAALEALAKDAELARRQRAEVVPDLSQELIAFYEKLRAQLDGVAAVTIKQRRCEGCRLELSATDLGRIRGADEDAIIRCEECRRIQVRTPESGL